MPCKRSTWLAHSCYPCLLPFNRFSACDLDQIHCTLNFTLATSNDSRAVDWFVFCLLIRFVTARLKHLAMAWICSLQKERKTSESFPLIPNYTILKFVTSSSSSLALQPGVGFSLLHTEGFVTIILLWCGVVAPRPTPNLEDQVSIFISPGDWVGQLYPQTPTTHFSRLLRHAWATVGLFFSPFMTQ
jgi:hypothetical protein